MAASEIKKFVGIILLRFIVLTLLPLSSTAAQAGGSQFVYDAGGRLVQVIQSDGSSARYAYDPAGNILSVTNLAVATLAVTGASNYSGASGSTTVIYGNGFSTTPSCNQVTINGVSATVTAATTNSLTITVPTGVTSGPVVVTKCSGGGTATGIRL